MAKIADEYEELINNATPNEIAAARENCCVGCRALAVSCFA
jgi:predicted  nucleic acid-binding Zn-ribbon protein